MSNLRNILLIFLLTASAAMAQEGKPIDRVIAVVGANIALQSELENQYMQMLAQGYTPNDRSRCEVFEQLMYQKLLLHQAQVDSVEVGEAEVEEEMNRRIQYFVSQLGSPEKLEEYYEKSILEIKDEFRTLIKNQLLSQKMEAKVSGDVKVTPSEVRAYFRSIHPDSLPDINSEVELGRIMKMPQLTKAQKDDARKNCNDIRNRVLAGESMKTMAILYSQDPGSAKKGGELGFFERGMMVPEFDAVAFKLRGDTVSEVFETEYGYHFMQLIERRGDQINVRHVLIQAKLSAEDLERARLELDSIYELISSGRMTFEKAAEKFSDDENSKQNGGLMFNPQTNTTKFETDLLSYIDKKLIFTIDRMKVGELSKPVLTTSPDNKESYSLFVLKSRTEPHRANLKDDYQRIQKVAEMDKQNRQVGEWVGEKAAKTFIRIDDEFKDCDFNNRWIN